MKSLLIANRGEIAIRIARAAAELGLRTVSVYSSDDAASLHVRKTDASVALPGAGPAAYLDIAGIVAAAKQAGCDAVHPGYGFLSENAAFARACKTAGLLFVGPDADTLELFGDKSAAKALARDCGVPVADGVSGPANAGDIKKYLTRLGHGGGVMIKAVAGGGGRGMRAVHNASDVDEAYARCQSEAKSFFGNADVYAERLWRAPRHIEVQIIGDGGAVSHVWERECTLQRRHQKLVEIAPCPSLEPALRARILDAAVRMAARARYRGLGTFEFLVEDGEFIFIECNARLQVEHTVTEEVTGIDLVVAQLRVAAGETLSVLGLSQDRIPAPSGYAMQLRINMETMSPTGQAQPSGGILRVFEPPSGRGVRTDSFGYAGYATSSSFDSLLAKLIVHGASASYADTVAKAYRALCEFRIEGVATNAGFLRNLLRHADVIANIVSTTFIEERIGELLTPADAPHRELYFADTGAMAQSQAAAAAPPGTVAVAAPMSARIVSVDVSKGQQVRRGQQVAVIEAMKAELVIYADVTGLVHLIAAAAGELILDGHPLLFIEPMELAGAEEDMVAEMDLDEIRPDLAYVMARHAALLDDARPEAVAKRHRLGGRTARENIADLVDPDSFVEYGGLILAAQHSRRSIEELVKLSPADGLVSGLAAVNGADFSEDKARCMVMAFDQMVLAGTVGIMTHRKTDRMFELAYNLRTPLILFSEGGGGRPGEDSMPGAGPGLSMRNFWRCARLSGLVPMIGINFGRCFAANTAFLGCCDVIIATKNSNIGVAGPAMIEAAGLGSFTAGDVGPVSVQEPNGVIDILVEDEADAVAAAKKYLSYFQGRITQWSCADQRELRPLVPENRLRAYDIRAVLNTIADTDSVLELRKNFGVGMVTAFIRVEGRPIGVMANNPLHLGGAIDSPASDKGARFMQLCDAFDIPLLMLCDTPGFMVGPESEKTAIARHLSRMAVTAASIDVPLFTVLLRKAYGFAAIAMAGGYMNYGSFVVSWPTGEVGAMGLEGAVRLGHRKALEEIADADARQARFQQLVDKLYLQGKAINGAHFLEFDDVIDPADTRKWIVQGLRNSPIPPARAGKKRPMVDTW